MSDIPTSYRDERMRERQSGGDKQAAAYRFIRSPLKRSQALSYEHYLAHAGGRAHLADWLSKKAKISETSPRDLENDLFDADRRAELQLQQLSEVMEFVSPDYHIDGSYYAPWLKWSSELGHGIAPIPDSYPWRAIVIERTASELVDTSRKTGLWTDAYVDAYGRRTIWDDLEKDAWAWFEYARKLEPFDIIPEEDAVAFRGWLCELDAAAAPPVRSPVPEVWADEETKSSGRDPDLGRRLKIASALTYPIHNGWKSSWPHIVASGDYVDIPASFVEICRNDHVAGNYRHCDVHQMFGVPEQVSCYHEGDPDVVLLLQLATDCGADFNWNDTGMLQFWILRDALKAGDFSRIWVSWGEGGCGSFWG